jgi:hypothetical protein
MFRAQADAKQASSRLPRPELKGFQTTAHPAMLLLQGTEEEQEGAFLL